ncbi:MAG TPA: LptF/LptG family permease [Gemmatimonadaceae bacterium]|jgi:lipopolysaccharide export system permease protein|nr:LptF/LptG family permease [Gemmatimonadaceae bacterium]
MLRRLLHPLDRYVLSEFWKIYVMTALGFPVLLIIIDLTDNLDKYLNRQLPRSQIALSYLYFIPDSMFLVMPAAVLFATVFSIGSLTRHSEITAAKASGISFHRLTLSIYIGAVVAAGLALALGELVPITNARRAELLEEKKFQPGTDRYNFAYAAEEGRVYKISSLNAEKGRLEGLEIERKGTGEEFPTYVLTADLGDWQRPRGTWALSNGVMHVIPSDTLADITFAFDSLYDRGMREEPMQLLATPKAPQEMGYRDLSRYIAALERSGGDANELRVERALKLAVPITCIIIALFGAPLATSTQRGGAAYGIGISLATTVIFLMLIQLTKAVGGKGIVTPEIAAWTPNVVFALIGLVMLARVRT